MKIVTKRIRVIQLTEEEMQKFYDCMERAREGHMSHYAEEKLEDGSFLGVSMVTKEELARNGRTLSVNESTKY